MVEPNEPGESTPEAGEPQDPVGEPQEPETNPYDAPASPAPAPKRVEGVDIGRLFNESIEFYKQNFLPLVMVSIVATVLMGCTLFILAGPVTGGLALVYLRGRRRPDQRVDFGDLFRGFDQFAPLVGLFFLTLIPYLVSYTCLIIPGLLLSTIWFLNYTLIVDKGLGVFDSLGASFQIVQQKGFLNVFLVALLTFVINLAASAVPYVGIVISWFVMPLIMGLWVFTYVQLVEEDTDGSAAAILADFTPRYALPRE